MPVEVGERHLLSDEADWDAPAWDRTPPAARLADIAAASQINEYMRYIVAPR
jgi:hypothetical protein